MLEAPFCPYVGLRPFHEEDRPYFFGREREVRSIADNLFGARITVFYGASGVGKSSVLMAGVVPELRGEPGTAAVVFRNWQIPNAAAQLRSEVSLAANQVAREDLGLDESLPLDELLKQAADRIDGTVLLILDQFEEFFLYFKDPEGGFDAELARAITRRDVDAGFLISLREDSLSKLDRFKKRVPALLANMQRLSHLRVGAAKVGIVKPLTVYNERHPEAAGRPVSIEPPLVEAVLEQTAPGQLSITATGATARAAVEVEEGHVEAPYLQLVLERLWSEEIGSGSRELRLETLERLGGAQKIVRTHLDQVLDRLDPRDQELCARIFDRLVTPSGAKIACTLSDLAAYADDLAAEVPRLTKFFDQNRILARIPAPPGAAEGDDQYQIFHDVIAPGILAWRERFLLARERAEAEAEAAERAREDAEEQRRRDLDATREEQLQAAQERALYERKHRKRFQYAMFGLVFWAAWAGIFGWNAYQESKAAQEARALAESRGKEAEESARLAKRALGGFRLEKIRDEYGKTRDREAALATLTEIIDQLDSNSAAAYAMRGRVRLDRALVYNVFDQELSGAQGSERPRDGLAKQEIDLAIADLDKSIQIDLRQPGVLVVRAEANQARGDLVAAIADYDAAIGMAPEDAQLLYNRGALRDRAGDKVNAIADYSAAIKVRPGFDDAYLARAELLNAAGRRKEAIEDLRRAVKEADDDRTRLAARRRLADLGAIAVAAPAPKGAESVYVHYVGDSDEDRRAAEAVRRALERNFNVPRIESLPGRRTSGDVRYLVSDDKDQAARNERLARTVATAAETALAQAGFKVGLRIIALDAKRFPDANPGVIEVWLPPLSRAVPQLQQRAL